MIGNPFDRGDGTWLVVVNDANQHALWPSFMEVPAGWRVVLRDADREAALDYVERNWGDLQPAGDSKWSEEG